MKTDATNSRLGDLLVDIKNEKLIPQPDFQRRLVWSNKDKVNFIRTVLQDYPFPEIYIAYGNVNPDTGESTKLLVDGQQRITTLYQYFTGSKYLKLPKDLKPYAKLDVDQKKAFLQYIVVIRDLGALPIDEIKEIFQKINSASYGLNAMEINNCRYDGAYITFNKEFALNDFFEQHHFFSSTEIHRMKDVLFCLSITTTLLSTYFNLDKEIDNYLIKYNESFPQAEMMKKNYDDLLVLIEQLNFDEKSRVFKKNDFYTLFIELYKALYIQKKNICKEKLAKNLKNFYVTVDNYTDNNNTKDTKEKAFEYYKNTMQGSNSRSSRISRGKIISTIITESLENK